MSAFIDRTGEIHRDLQITKELGGGMIEARCLICDRTEIYDKYRIINDLSRCKYTDCSNNGNHIKDRVGETYNNMVITKEIGKAKVEVQCLVCGKSFIYCKSSVVSGHFQCKNMNCSNKNERQSRLISTVGEIHKGLKVTKEIGENKVEAQCLACGEIFTYLKKGIISDYALCRNKRCINSARSIRKSRVGEVHNNLKITKELGEDRVEAQCVLCGHTEVYRKNTLTNKHRICAVCGVTGLPTCKKIEGLTLKNVIVIKYEYKGRNGQFYYTCKCIKCNEELILSYGDIFTYQCDKE